MLLTLTLRVPGQDGDGTLTVNTDLTFRLDFALVPSGVLSGKLHDGRPSEEFLLESGGRTLLQGVQRGFGVCHPHVNLPWGNVIAPIYDDSTRNPPAILTVQFFDPETREAGSSLTVFRNGQYHASGQVTVLSAEPDRPLVSSSPRRRG